MAPDLISEILPRVLIVSRRTLRKNKFVDFVGEYHLDLIVRYGAVPVIVPRVSGVHMLLDSFEPIHGVLLCEGEDIDPSMYQHLHQPQQPDEQDNVVSSSTCCLSAEELEEIRRLHASDTAIDPEKDSIELRLAKLCLERNIPYLGICRGSQVLNVACGGTLYQDIAKQLHRDVIEHHRRHHTNDDDDGDGDYLMEIGRRKQTTHIDYDNYDEHRHPVRLVEGTPLRGWFKDSLEAKGEERESIMVNSYHHQGVKRLAQRFVPMAFAPDGLIEAFYDPDAYSPDQGRFIMGLQFHPERMRCPHDPHNFDYPGCPSAYQEFVKAVVAYRKKLNTTPTPACVKLDKQMEKKRNTIIRSFSLARNMYTAKQRQVVPFPSRESYELQAGAEFLESNTVLSEQQENRLMQMGATVRNASSYFQKLKMNGERESLARSVMGKMRVEQLTDLLSFYHMMSHICSEVLQTKIQDHIAITD